MAWSGIINAYREFLPVSDETPVVTLGEGNTPLLEVPSLARAIDLPARLYLKYEGLNPTCSFKDRGMTVAVSKAKEAGSEAVVCASTGNTSASAAAFAARAGMRCIVLLPEGAIAKGKLAQALMHGAQVLAVQGNFDEALWLVRKLAQNLPVTLVNSVNPHRLEGQKTGAFEVCDQLGDVPDYLAIPVGNAGNITAYWKGFRHYRRAGKTTAVPKMLGFQAEGAAPIVDNRVYEHPETVASAIRIGRPASWNGATKARDESGGVIGKVSDDEILEAYRLIARLVGIFCEPASAAAVAGVGRLAREGFFKAGDRVVCVLTGHGLKDPDQAMTEGGEPTVVPAQLDAVRDAVISKGTVSEPVAVPGGDQ